MTTSEMDRTAASGLQNAVRVGRFAPGQMIAERFAVVRYVARGGMGEVYEVEDRFLQNVHVALKVIVPEIAGSLRSSHHFEQEVLLARKVVHPNLCPIYDIARCDNPAPPFLFLTMKLLAGETLAARLRRPGLVPRDQAMAIVRQLVAGLAAIHAAGVIHRDIKPNNVMLDVSGPELCVSIMDFGLARLHAPDTTIASRSMLAGTPGFMAPEILRGEGPSQASDLFALGVLLHHLLAGEPPKLGPISLSAEATPALAKANVPAAIVRPVRELLSSDPARRCVAFEQLKEALPVDGRSGHAGLRSLGARHWSRREFAIGSTVAAGTIAGGVAWNRERLYDYLHPLPVRRFVALVGWPPAAEDHLKATISSIVDAIGSELARAEAFDHNLLVIPRAIGEEVTSLEKLNAVRESLGANLVLAASGSSTAKRFDLMLRVIDPASSETLREKRVMVASDAQLKLPEMAVRSAASVLNILRYKPDDQRSKVGTTNADAYAAFKTGERLSKQDNDMGLEAAVEQYKAAIEADPMYADAQAALSQSYLRTYGLRGDGAALMLAKANAKAAIQQDPNQVTAHLVLASVSQKAGDQEGALREMAEALALDPMNPHTLTYQADFYAETEHWREAEETYARVLSLRPNYWLAHNQLGFLLSEQAKYAQALLEFQSASLAAPRNALAYANVGGTYLQLGNVREAIANFTKSYQLTRNDGAAAGLAAANRISGDLSAAVAYAQDSVDLNPSEATNWIEMGDCYAARDLHGTQATAAYQRAREIQEDRVSNEPRAGSAWMLLALCRMKAGSSGTVASLAEKAEKLGAKDIDSQLIKVRIFALLREFDDALATIGSLLRRGATGFQFETMPDLVALRRDPRYQHLVTVGRGSIAPVGNETK